MKLNNKKKTITLKLGPIKKIISFFLLWLFFLFCFFSAEGAAYMGFYETVGNIRIEGNDYLLVIF